MTTTAHRTTSYQIQKRKKAFSFVHTWRIVMTSCWVGAATRMPRHRDRMAGMTWEMELAESIRRHVEMYFSIVRRSACWASFVRRSTSSSRITAILFVFLWWQTKVWFSLSGNPTRFTENNNVLGNCCGRSHLLKKNLTTNKQFI